MIALEIRRTKGTLSPPRLARLAGWATLLGAIGAGCSSGDTIPAAAGKLDEAIARAKPGDVITLPAGTVPGGIRLPAGVGLRGAGYRETTIDAGKAEAGVSIDAGSGAEVSDLTIRGGMTGLLARGASGVVVRRVRATGAINGIRFVDVTGGRIENVVSDGNRYGIIVSGGRDDVVVNCTVAGNESLGLSLASGEGHAAFNNCTAGASMGVFVGEVAGVRLDHNLYFTPFTGRSRDQLGRRALEDWKYLSGLDPHSVAIPVTFRDGPAGDYTPVGTLAWSLARAATTDWGVEKLGGIAAPDRDIDGRARVGRVDVGAYEVAPAPPRPADGTLTIRSDAGIKSAGVFDDRGREVSYLFHNLPLPAGDHPFWLPARDAFGRRIAAGTYEVRSVEADHRWDYLGWVGDTGEATPPGLTASAGLSAVAFDDAGRLFAAQNWSEDATNIRCFEAATGKVSWTVGGSAMGSGFAYGSGGVVYFAQPGDGGNWELSRIDAASGRVLAAAAKGPWRVPLGRFANVFGLAELDGKLYVTDTAGDKLWIGSADGSRWDSVAVPKPSAPAADPTTHVVWVISEGKRVLALGPDGKVVSERDFSALMPRALAAGHGRLAIATGAEGLVRVLDVPDPKSKAKSGRTVGRGDGPFGPYLPDRFLFQQAPGAPNSHVALAIGPKGELAVVDQNRLLVFDEAGHHVWGTFGVFGNNTAPSFANPERVYDTDGRRSLLLTVGADGAGTWRPEGYFDIPVSGRLFGDFASEGKVYGVFQVETRGKPNTDLVLCRYDGFRADPVFAVIYDAKDKQYFSRKDTNRDGRLDARDGGEVVTGPDGKPYRGALLHPRFNSLQPNGDILILATSGDQWGMLWHPSRGADGTPVYRLNGLEKLPRAARDVPSPYSRKPDQVASFIWAEPDPRGGLFGNINLKDSPDGYGIMNNAGTDVAAVDREGRLRWVHTLDHDRGLEGLGVAGPVLITGVATTAEVIALDRDGLGLGSFSPPAKAHYQGYFLDHPQAVRAYKGPDGGTYALIADNYNGRHHWYRLAGADRIRPYSAPLSLTGPGAEALAALPSPPPYVSTRPAQPVVRIPKLDRPMPIDGGLEKWRTAVPKPQIVVTPESSYGKIDGPKDCSAVVRLAYQGEDLYVQFLIFDDVVSFHQDVSRHYKQDGVEMCLNGFQAGFKFDASVTTDAGPLVLRNRFFFQKLNWAMPESQVPRVMKVLDHARDVPERDLIEGVYGLDMSGSRVNVIEFKLPIDAVTYKDSEKEWKEITPWGPGREFWLGLLINDNDEPGTDVQDFLVWPPSYNNFGPVGDGARAVLE